MKQQVRQCKRPAKGTPLAGRYLTYLSYFLRQAQEYRGKPVLKEKRTSILKMTYRIGYKPIPIPKLKPSKLKSPHLSMRL